MSEWKVSMNVREVMLLDSQDMDYNVELQKDKQDCDCQQTNLQQWELIAMKHNRVLVGRM
jgi:hypothetical protein